MYFQFESRNVLTGLVCLSIATGGGSYIYIRVCT